MGDGYCRHCDDEDQTIAVEEDFLFTLLCHVDQDMLARVQDSLREEIEDNCDNCGGERSRQLLALMLKAQTANRSQCPRIVTSLC